MTSNKPKAIFYFDYLSPWAYFGFLKLKDLLKTGVISEIDYQPVPYPKLAEFWRRRAVATVPSHRLCIYKHALRHARSRGIPLETPKQHPYRPYPSLRLSLKEVAKDRQPELVERLFEACWVKKVDMGSDVALAHYLQACGFEGDRLVAETQKQSVKGLLTSNTESAVRRGVFGVPTVFIGEELFWGSDQFAFIEDFVNGKDPAAGYRLPESSWGLGTERPAPSMITGVAHTIFSVSNFERSRVFYKDLLSFLGLTLVFDGKETLYYVGGKTAVGIGQCPNEYKAQPFVKGSVGLHHVCFRARSREDVDRVYDFLKARGTKITYPAKEGPWAPGYYSVAFEDPDGIAVEVNYIPGEGVLAAGAKFNPAGDYR